MKITILLRRIQAILFFSILITPIFFIFVYKYQDTECISNILKDLGTALTITSALFSFALSWLTDSKGYLSKIYEIENARKLYDKLNEKTSTLFFIWKSAFFISLLILAYAYFLGTFEPAPTNCFASKYFYALIFSALLVFLAYWSVYKFFSTAAEILEFKNDLEKEICRLEAKKRIKL